MNSSGFTPLHLPVKKPIFWHVLDSVTHPWMLDFNHRYICKQLINRNESCLDLWSIGNQFDLVLVRKVSTIIMEYMRWPNIYYIPDDPCSILFYDNTIDMRNATALSAISDIVSGDLSFDNYAFGKFSDLISTIELSALQPQKVE